MDGFLPYHVWAWLGLAWYVRRFLLFFFLARERERETWGYSIGYSKVVGDLGEKLINKPLFFPFVFLFLSFLFLSFFFSLFFRVERE